MHFGEKEEEEAYGGVPKRHPTIAVRRSQRRDDERWSLVQRGSVLVDHARESDTWFLFGVTVTLLQVPA